MVLSDLDERTRFTLVSLVGEGQLLDLKDHALTRYVLDHMSSAAKQGVLNAAVAEAVRKARDEHESNR